RSGSVVEHFPDAVDSKRIFPAQNRGHFFVDQGHQACIVARTACRDLRLAPTGDASVGIDLNDRGVERFCTPEVTGVLSGLGNRYPNPRRGNVGDLHSISMAPSMHASRPV